MERKVDIMQKWLHRDSIWLHRGSIWLHRGCIWLHRGCIWLQRGGGCTILQYMQYMAAGWLATGIPRLRKHAQVVVTCWFQGPVNQ